jgi:hypothetical protein
MVSSYIILYFVGYGLFYFIKDITRVVSFYFGRKKNIPTIESTNDSTSISTTISTSSSESEFEELSDETYIQPSRFTMNLRKRQRNWF